MDRKIFAQKLALLGVCPFVIHNLLGSNQTTFPKGQDENFEAIKWQKQFVENWLSDLLDSMNECLDRETQEKIAA